MAAVAQPEPHNYRSFALRRKTATVTVLWRMMICHRLSRQPAAARGHPRRCRPIAIIPPITATVHSTFSIASLNMHKGLSPLNRRVIVHDLKAELDVLKPDIVFLQEVQGRHARHAQRFANWPAGEQGDFLAGPHWPEVHYARNAVYAHGHHGNAILSRFAVESCTNDDMSMHRFEARGLLHAIVHIGGQRVHCFCIHLGLTERVRARQMAFIMQTLRERVGREEPVVLAGDFNDWRNRVEPQLAEVGVLDSFTRAGHKPPRTFPGRLPLLRLDRIYTRALAVREARVLHHLHRLSDHIGLHATLALT